MLDGHQSVACGWRLGTCYFPAHVTRMLVLTPSGSPHFDQSIPVQNLTGPPAQGSKKENLAIFAETSNKTFIISQQYFKKYPLLNQLNLSPSRKV